MSNIYTVNHKKRDILFLTITLANLNRFLQFLYHFNREEILHTTVVKFTTLIVCAPYFVNLNNNFSVKNAIIFSSFTFTAKEIRNSSSIIKFTVLPL